MPRLSFHTCLTSFARISALLLVCVVGTHRSALAQTDSLAPEPYLAYTLLGQHEISIFELDSRIRVKFRGQNGYVVGYITDVSEEYLFLNGRPIPHQNIITLHRYSEKIERQRKAATWGSAGATAGFFAGALLTSFAYEFIPVALGSLMSYYGAALAPSLLVAKPLITRKYRTTDVYWFTMGPLDLKNPSNSNPDNRTDQSAQIGRSYPSLWKPTVPRTSVGLWASGDGTFGIDLDYLVTSKFAIGFIANPWIANTLQVGAKIYTRSYLEDQWNWHINLKGGTWNSAFRPLQVSGFYLGSGFQQYPNKWVYWGAQGGAWLDGNSGILVPEVSAQVGVRLGPISEYLKN